jgi:hypothetical protein
VVTPEVRILQAESKFVIDCDKTGALSAFRGPDASLNAEVMVPLSFGTFLKSPRTTVERYGGPI